jgi:hypothetical protein
MTEIIKIGAETEIFKFESMKSLCMKYNVNEKTLNMYFTKEHKTDMELLGKKRNANVMPPSVVMYIEKVVLMKQDKTQLWPNIFKNITHNIGSTSVL